MFREYMDLIYERYGTEDTMHDTIDIISNVVEEMQVSAPETYKTLMCKLEEYLYRIPLDEAQMIVANMSNEYGMSGERWSYDQICNAAKQYQVSDDIDRVDLYIVMNMWNIDYHKTMKNLGLESRTDVYIMFSRDWLKDSDFGKGKVYKYFVKIHEDEDEEIEEEE